MHSTYNGVQNAIDAIAVTLSKFGITRFILVREAKELLKENDRTNLAKPRRRKGS